MTASRCPLFDHLPGDDATQEGGRKVERCRDSFQTGRIEHSRLEATPGATEAATFQLPGLA
jgi:hypothetical protein